MTIDIATVITDYDWCEEARPELRLSQSDGKHFAVLSVGGAISGHLLELSGGRDGLLSELEGYAEIFAAAVAHLKALP